MLILDAFPPMSRVCLCAATCQGKTFFATRYLIEKFKKNSLVHIFVFSLIPQQTLYTKLRDVFEIERLTFKTELEELDQILELPIYHNKKIIFFFDDVYDDMVMSKTVSKMFKAYSHHKPIYLIMYTTQNYFMQGTYALDIKRNSNFLVLFKTPLASGILDGITRNLLGQKGKKNIESQFLQDAYRSIIEEKEKKGGVKNYLIINTDANHINEMLCSGILKNERKRYFTIEEY
jgi:hypothetical protein